MKTAGQNHQKAYIVTYFICVIQVYGANLTITQDPQYPIASSPVWLTCHIPSFTGAANWIRNGTRLQTRCFKAGFCTVPSIEGYQFRADTTMMNVTISSLNRAIDETNWTCTHNSDTDIGYFNLIVYTPVGSVQVKNGTNLTLIESQSAVLVCETDACRPSAAIFWMKNGTNITDSPTSVNVKSVNSSMMVSIGTLNYTGQRRDDGTLLACGAYNGLGIVKTSANLALTIYYPPFIEGLTSPYKVIENQSLNVTCVVTSNPPADLIFWSPDGEGSVKSTLYFSSVSRNNSGNYSCTAQNTMIPTSGTQQNGTNTSQIQVDVLYPPSIQGLKSPYKVIEKQSFNLTCEVNSNPPTNQTYWTPKGDGSVSSILYFSSLSRNKSGIYNCTAQNTMKPTVGTQQNGISTTWIEVDVLYPPSIEGLNSSYKVIENQTLNVTCVATSNPPADLIFWSPIGEGSVNSTLYFSSVTRNNSGNYTCTAQNTMIPTSGTQQNGTNRSQIQVDVLYPPTIHGLKSLYKVIEKQPLNVTCEVNSNPPADQISWSPKGEGSLNSTLYFQSVSRNISGNYSCTAQNTMISTVGTQQNGTNTSQIQVDVLYPPSIHGLTSPYKVIENQSLDVTCVATSNPPADRIFWSPKGEGLVNSTLYFSLVSRNNSGNYSCTVQNTMIPTTGPQQSGNSTSQIQVDVQYGASISNLSVHGSNTINENSSAIFKCLVESNPPSNITWMKEDSSTVLKSESGVVHSNYSIKSVECLDMGNYTCTAHNGIWTGVKERLELFVKCHPRTDFRLNQETKLYKKRHEEAILRYTVISYPPSRFTWTFVGNGGEIRGLPVSASQQDNGQQSELRITNLDITDFGNYSVIADNSLAPSAMVVFEIIQAEPNTDNLKNSPLAAVVGGIGAGVGVILVVVLVVFLVRRYRHHKQYNDGITDDKTERSRPESGLVDNPVYDTSGPLPGPSASAGITEAEYAKVNKPKKKASNMNEASNIYAQVDKTKKNFKKDKGKHGKMSRGDIYENAADLVVNAKAETCNESLYEDARATGSNGPLKNKDGLHYADLMLGPPSKKDGKDIIRGIENRTEYAEIAYGKRGEPLPDSDN